MSILIRKEHTFTGHNDCVYTLEEAGVDHLFFSAGGDGMVALWDLHRPNHGELIAKLPDSVYALHRHVESDLLIAGHNYNGIRVLNWKEKKEVASLQLTVAAIFAINSFNNLLFVGTGDGSLMLLNLKTMQLVDTIKLSEKSVRAIAVNAATEEVAVGYSDHFIRVFDLKDMHVKYEWVAHNNSVFSLRYLPGGLYLISGSRDARLKVWDVRGGYGAVNDVAAHLFAINDISFRQDGRYFVTGSMDKSIKVWDTDTQRLLKVIDKSRHAGHGTSVNKVLWSTHENQVISASDDRTISIWSVIFE